MKKSIGIYSKIIIVIFLIMLVVWLYIFSAQLKDTTLNFIYGAALGVLPFLAAFFGFNNAKHWGGFSSSMGRAVYLLSGGLLTWGIGTLIFAYYNLFLNVAVPYPSLADALYIISWPLWAISMIYFSRATGVKFQLSNLTGRIMLFIIPIIAIILSYYALIIVARGGVVADTSGGALKTFFDLAYPIGDLVILTIALLIYGLSFNYLGGIFKWSIVVVLAGFVTNYIGDFLFVFTVTKETYFVANWVDLIYTTAFFLLSLGATLLDPRLVSKDTT